MILDLTMPRLRQVQDMILARRDDERQFVLRLEEVKLQAIVGAVHAAAGNKRGAAAAQKIRLARREESMPDFDEAMRLFNG